MKVKVKLTMPDKTYIIREVQGENIGAVLIKVMEMGKNYKKYKRFSDAYRKASEIEILTDKPIKIKLNKAGRHLKLYIAKCNSVFKKIRHADIMVMFKLKYNRAKVALLLHTSESNLKALLKEIFEILGVRSEHQGVAVLSII